MSDEAKFDQQTSESLEAMGRLIHLCLPDSPCGVDGCRKCRKNAEAAWQSAMSEVDRFISEGP